MYQTAFVTQLICLVGTQEFTLQIYLFALIEQMKNWGSNFRSSVMSFREEDSTIEFSKKVQQPEKRAKQKVKMPAG